MSLAKWKVACEGQTYARMTIREITQSGTSLKAHCQCSCGNEKTVLLKNLRSGMTKSCGCFRDEQSRAGFARYYGEHHTHGESRSKLYAVWNNMKRRCYSPSSDLFKHFGERGIRVCDEWRLSYPAFATFARANGYREGMIIDLRDKDRDYSPENTRFITRSEKMKNSRKPNARSES